MLNSAYRLQGAGGMWVVVLALSCTIPAFYLELLQPQPPVWSSAAYALAALVLAGWAWGRRKPAALGRPRLACHPVDVLLSAGLAVAAFLPPSNGSTGALVFRLAVALLTLLRLVLLLQYTVTRGSLLYLLGSAGLVLLLCGVGFWWLEPRVATLGDGLWLAFTTAATVGYGDIVPSTPASRIFSVFVVMLGFGVLSLVTAAVATRWIETEERIIEREVLRDLHRQMDAVHQELGGLKTLLTDIAGNQQAVRASAGDAAGPRPKPGI